MHLARAIGPADAGPGLFAIEGDTAVRLGGPAGADPILDTLRAGSGFGLPRGAPEPSGELRLLAPIGRPGKIVAVGLNYADHTSETGLAAPAEPLTFAKYPSAVTGPNDDIVVPATVTKEVDWEVELAVVVGRTCGPDRRGTVDDVAGYTVANDVSARDLQFRDQQWTRGKSLDTFCPLGPVLVTADELADVGHLRIWAEVNGTRMQDASTADMIFDVAALLDFLTATVTLEAGDIVLTGTPPGVGGFRTPPVYLQDGDVVSVGVDGIGALRNTVRWV
jgi:2-keto-4-pentenoate hydratase/2-oxohepta-3-ene-1,7-dioic acid hydratase in catechol pathway